MPTLLFANNAQTTLAGPIASGALSVNLAAGTGSEFPAPTTGQYFVMTFTDAATGLIHEIVFVTARSGDTLTVVRAQEGTTARSWSAGDIAGNWWTAGSAATMVQVQTLQTQPGNYAVDTGSVNNIQISLNPTPATLATIAGAPIRVLVGHTNTGATTLTIAGLASTVVFPQSGSTSTLPAGAVVGGQIYEFTYVPSVGFEVATAKVLLSTANTWAQQQTIANNVWWSALNNSGAGQRLIGIDPGNEVTLFAAPSGPAAWRVADATGASNLMYLGSAGLLNVVGGITSTLGATGTNDQFRVPVLADFGSIVSNPGGNGNYLYQKIPGVTTNGMVMQCFGGVNATGIDSVIFPQPFPNNCLHVLVNEANPQGWFGAGVAPTILSGSQVGANGFTLYVVVWNPGTGVWQLKGGVAYQYIAIGF